MTLHLSADEILEIAQRIEQNGARFYRRAAELQKDENKSKLLLQLARMEDEHERIFLKIQDDLTEEERSQKAADPFGEMKMYLSAMADTSGGEGSPAAVEALTGQEPIGEILKKAIELEKESILYYIGLKDVVPGQLSKKNIEKIIEEEKSHIILLKKELDAL